MSTPRQTRQDDPPFVTVILNRFDALESRFNEVAKILPEITVLQHKIEHLEKEKEVLKTGTFEASELAGKVDKKADEWINKGLGAYKMVAISISLIIMASCGVVKYLYDGLDKDRESAKATIDKLSRANELQAVMNDTLKSQLMKMEANQVSIEKRMMYLEDMRGGRR